MKLPSAASRLVLLDQALVSGASFVSTALLVRALGLETFGAFSLLWLGVLLALGLGQACVVQPMLAIAPKLEDRGGAYGEYRGAVLALQLGFTAALACVALAVYPLALARWGGAAVAGCAAPAVLVLVARQLQAFARASLFARGAHRAAIGTDAVAHLGQVVGIVALERAGRLDVATALWVIGGFSIVAALPVLARHPRRTTRAALVAATRRHAVSARWLAPVQLAQFFASNSYLVAAAALLGAGAVGAIKAAQTVVGVLHVGFLAMENLVPVSASRLLVRGGSEAFLRYVGRVGAWGLAATATVATALAAAPEPVLRLAYGERVEPRLELALRALALLAVFGFAIALLQITFRALERTRPIFFAYAVHTLVALAVAEPVVRAFGFAGAVFGMALSQGFMASLLAVALAIEVRIARYAPLGSGLEEGSSR